MPVQAFGDAAARRAGRLDGAASVIVCEPGFATSALATAVALRRTGTRFCASIVWDDARTRAARERSLEACARYATWDEVRLVMHEFVDSGPARWAAIAAEEAASLHEFVRLADTLVAPSWAECLRIEVALGSIPRPVEIVIDEVPIPVERARERTDVVVYAPLERADALGVFVTGLADLAVPVTVVAADAPTIASANVRFVGPGDGAAALARARAIVDAGNDPGTALALARLGVPLAVAATGGANEVLRGVATFDPWNARSVLAATMDALAGEPPQRRPEHWMATVTPPVAPVPLQSTPLVTIVVPTHNRAQMLDTMLASVDRQTYPAIETIVVNDAGPSVNEIVARHPHTRAIDHLTNRGPAAARNTGARAARGEYVIFFDDDDEMFPDHITALVNAAERTGFDVAYGQMINCFLIPVGAGRFVVDGLLAHYALLDHAEIQWGASLATTAVLFRRRLFELLGPVDESLDNSEDYEFWLRLAAGREWARVSAVTSLYSVRTDGTNRSSERGAARRFAAHSAIYAKHASDRPLVAAGRSAMLGGFAPPR